MRVIRLLMPAVCCLLVSMAAVPTHAQNEGSEPKFQQDDTERRDRGQHRRGRHDRKRDGRYGRLQGLFRPSPEDFGPLQPGEMDELRAFLQAELPQLDHLIARLEKREPREYEHKLKRLLPHVRHLRRLHGENPELAGLVARHADNLFRIEALRKAYDEADAERRTVIERSIRSRVADNVQVRIKALRLWADQLEATRDARIADKVAALLQPEADLSAEHERVRERVRTILATEDEVQRRQLEDELTTSLTAYVDARIAGMREYAETMKANTEAEVDRRCQRIMERRPSRGRGHGPRGSSDP